MVRNECEGLCANAAELTEDLEALVEAVLDQPRPTRQLAAVVNSILVRRRHPVRLQKLALDSVVNLIKLGP